MIRINLLPVQTLKKKESLKSLITIYVILLIGAVACCALLKFMVFDTILADKATEIDDLKAEKQKTDNEVKAFEKQQAETLVLAGKAYALNLLEDSRRNKVKLLRDLPLRLIKDQVWLTKLVLDQDGNWNCDGIATDNDPIAQVMSNLSASSLFYDIRLVESKKRGPNTNLMTFTLQGRTALIADVVAVVSQEISVDPKKFKLEDIGNTLTKVNPSFKSVTEMNRPRMEL